MNLMLDLIQRKLRGMRRAIVARKCSQACYTYAVQLMVSIPGYDNSARVMAFTDPCTKHVYFRKRMPVTATREEQRRINFWFRSAVRYLRLSENKLPFRRDFDDRKGFST